MALMTREQIDAQVPFVVFPRDEAEAAALQQRFFLLGFSWPFGRRVYNLGDRLKYGIVVYGDGQIYVGTDGSRNKYKPVSIDAFIETSPKLSDFNALAARVERMEKMLEEIHQKLCRRSLLTPPGQKREL